jgi:hypothetical protein
MNRNGLILTQYRNSDEYNDFIGKFYHFPVNNQKNYLRQFENLPLEFVYYEPEKHGDGVFYGYGRIRKKPFIDRKDNNFFYVEIDEYKPFSKPVYFKDNNGEILEKIYNVEYYNYNNSVRKIAPSFLDELCLDGGIILNIESDAHLIKVLGEQLIGSEKVGILELIKNSIDAGASYCRVRIEKIDQLSPLNNDAYEYPDLQGPVIIIEDDGIGMSKDVIENGWLRPASPIKTNIKEQLRLERQKAMDSGSLGSYDSLLKLLQKETGRIPLGEKGVGRFATHRLGRFLELRTKTQDNPYELVLKIDWNEFDAIKTNTFTNLNSIGVSLLRSELTKDYGEKNSGTKLLIYGGREGFLWDRKIIEELNSSILNLNSPIDKHIRKKDVLYPIFKVIPEFPQMDDDLPKSLAYEDSKPNFTLDMIVNERGVAEIYELSFKHPTDKLPQEEWSDKNIDLRFLDEEDRFYWYKNAAKRNPDCGAFYFQLKVWYRSNEWIDIEEKKQLINYLDEYGGISIYRDGILISDSKRSSEYDWLGLASKHIKQGFRMSYRDFIGSIEIQQGENIYLIDKTDREGFIENRAAKDLAHLVTSAIEKIVFIKYKEKREQFAQLNKGLISDTRRLTDLAKISSKIFSNVSHSDYPLETDPYKFFADLWEKAEEKRLGIINLERSMKDLQKSIKMIEDVQDLFVEQAGFGIAVKISLHEINKITANFYNGIAELIKNKNFDKIKLEDLKNTSASLRSELKRLGPLRSVRNERSIEFDILETLNYTYEVFRRKLSKENIDFVIDGTKKKFRLFGRYSTLTQVFANLLDNSLYWITYSGKKEKKITVFINSDDRCIIFADSGSNINDIIRPNLFQPGYSLREPPSGLGLYICKMYLENMRARIYETPTKDRLLNLDGAQFTLDFSKTPEGAN